MFRPGKVTVTILGKRKAPRYAALLPYLVLCLRSDVIAIYSIEKNFQDERADERRKRFQKDNKEHKKKNPVVFSQPVRGPLIDTVRNDIVIA